MADGYPLVVLAPLAGLALDFLAHLLTAILTAGRRVAIAIVTGFFAGLVGTAALSGLGLLRMAPEPADAIALCAFNLVIYLALAYGYFNFVNLNMTSLRIRVLLELLEARAGLSREDLLRLYDAGALIERRITRLTRQGHLVEQQGRFCCRGFSLVFLARVITLMKWTVLGHGNQTLQKAADREKTIPNKQS